MNDKEIRKILISYLTANNREIRIYQEKNIGSSICDVMAVTDILTGYEIKGDGDTYVRLPQQIKEYSKFFEKNYLVVSNSHIKSAPEKIPSDWGIILIQDDNVRIVRNAVINKNVSRRKQLSVLWKLELKNILIKNNQPLYAQKEKGFIADKIATSVDSNILRGQIAYELMHRDYSVFDAKDYTIYSNNGEEFPAEELVDMLSEKNLNDFTLDKWIELYKHASDMKEMKNNLNLKKPEDAITEKRKHTVPYTDIEVYPGVPWVSADIMNDFVYYLLGQTYRIFDGIKTRIDYVFYESVTGYWAIRNKKNLRNVNCEVNFGTYRYNALQILEATMNLREIKIYDKENKYNEKETLAVLEKQKLLIDEFRKWLWEDEDRIWLVEEAYNKLFDKFEKPLYDGSNLEFPSMNKEYSLYPYQKDAVQKIITSKNTLLAFDVGAGKTYIMIAAAMNMRHEGISRKNLFVVPNHIVGQWEKIFTELYPSAKVLAIEPKTFKPEMRQKVLRQIRDGDYDGIIIAYSCFEMIPLTADTVTDNMNQQLKRISDAINDARHGMYISYHHSYKLTPLNRHKEYVIKLTKDFIESMNAPLSDDITFEDLDINTLFLDEAHNYKNLPIKTQLKNLNGINIKGSKKCLDMLHKIRFIQQSNEGRGAVFATGTPLCNSISDAYTMQMYLQYEELVEAQLDSFDNWIKTFAKYEQICEIDVDTSKIRFINKFVKFYNLPELSRMFSQIAIFYAVDNKDGLPTFDGYTDVIVEKYSELTDYMKQLCDRTELIRSGMIDRKYDNMLKVSTDGRKAALDLKLVGAEQPYNDSSKVYKCVENVSSLYFSEPDTTQLIFCDYSTPKGADFSVYKEIKERLAEKGIPEKEIAFIHNYQTESRKVELFRKFNAVEMRILIGSTFKLGVGANVQVKLKAIHHLDVPWRPADMVQREGRIVRRGNTNENVLIYRYITQGSFDSYSWQILETKQKFISQFLTGSTYQRSASDLENNILSYAEVKALALSEPLMKQLAEKENEIKNLEILVAKEEDNKQKLTEELGVLEKKLLDTALKNYSAYMYSQQLKNFSNDDFLKAYHSLSDNLSRRYIYGEEVTDNPITVMDFTIVLPENQSDKKPYIYLQKDTNRFLVYMGDSAVGNAKRVINYLKRFDKVCIEFQENIATMEKRKKDITEILQNSSDIYNIRLAKCLEEKEEIMHLITRNMDDEFLC